MIHLQGKMEPPALLRDASIRSHYSVPIEDRLKVLLEFFSDEELWIVDRILKYFDGRFCYFVNCRHFLVLHV